MKRILPYLAGAIVLSAISLLVIFHKQPRRFDGRITLNPTHKIPYGAYVSYQLLQQQFPGAKLLISNAAPEEWKLPAKDTTGLVLFILINYFNPTSEELNSLTYFAQKGNTVFISALQMNETAQHFFSVKEDDLYGKYSVSQNSDAINISDSFSVSLDTTVFTPPYSFSYPGISYHNRFIRYDSIYTYPLGYNSKTTFENLLAIHTLKGTFLLHSAPITFSNLFLLYGNNHVYFEKLMSLLPSETKYILWDEYFMYRKSVEKDDHGSVLHVLLKYENFRWAFWLTIIVVALYVVTEMKRRQRLTPEYTRPANDTVNFVTTIGKLYFEKGDHKNLAEKLSVYFLDFVRNKYKIPTTEINPQFAKTLAAKSKVPVEEITAITDDLIQIRISDSITQQQLMKYYNRLEQFYSNV